VNEATVWQIVAMVLTLVVVILAYRTLRVGQETAGLTRDSAGLLQETSQALRHLNAVARQEALVGRARRDVDVGLLAMDALSTVSTRLAACRSSASSVGEGRALTIEYGMACQQFAHHLRPIDADEQRPTLRECWEVAHARPPTDDLHEARFELSDVIAARQKVLAHQEAELTALVARGSAGISSGPE